jgi:hypothetical protein
LGQKRTSDLTSAMSAFDPKQTLRGPSTGLRAAIMPLPTALLIAELAV